MPHSVGPGEATDSGALADFLGEDELSALAGVDLNQINEDAADNTGEKAEDALDFGEISDDDLAEDETDLKPLTRLQPDANDEEEDDELDDLFGDGLASPPPTARDENGAVDDELAQESADVAPSADEEPEEEDAETREQRLLFEQAQKEREDRLRRAESATSYIPAPESNEELFRAMWPQFDPDRPLRFGELIPNKKAHYVGKTPLKPPKPIHPTKVNLDLEPDQEKLFKTVTAPHVSLEARIAQAEAKGLVLIAGDEDGASTSEDEDDFDLLDQSEEIGGVSWQDLVAICQDWDIPDAPSTVSDDEMDIKEDPHVDDLFLDEDDFDTLENPRPLKRVKREQPGNEPLRILHNLNVSFEDPLKATEKLAKRVHLDMNDSRLLIDDHVPPAPPVRNAGNFKRDASGKLTKDLIRRYNISNDEEYDLLKQNHQNRVRSQVGNTPVHHAGVALRLQFPFYKQHLPRKEARSWHRPSLMVTPGDVLFKKPISHKRKAMRGREPSEIFATSADLTVGDNSSIMLFEYSEETPPMLNSMGMASRLINYYRRKDEEDTSRPKLDVGETAVLLPQDKSPFDIFGDVDRGQITPTLSNSMYRAPVFRHQPKPQDFLISRSSTGLHGSVWHMRNIEGLHVVGQEYPFVEVPGPKARFSTNVAKGRLQMVSYRMYNRSKGKLSMEMVRRHNPHTDVPTIRTKMREFMQFDKSAGQGKGIWVPKDSSEVPDEAGIRGLVKPEDVALLYAMQVGQQHLSDAGYHRQGEDDMEEEENEDGDKPAGNLDRQLAPWNTTKNFLLSCTDKAMIEVHGEGDPTGRGEALSMIKTSMKGGFKAIGQSIEDRLDANRQKELGGHKYNVARQKQEYADAIRRVWDAQARSLSSTEVRDDADMAGVEDLGDSFGRAQTPASSMPKTKRDDESASAFSRASSQDQTSKVLRITRDFVDKFGDVTSVTEVVRDPKIIREYQRRRRIADLENLRYSNLVQECRAIADLALALPRWHQPAIRNRMLPGRDCLQYPGPVHSFRTH